MMANVQKLIGLTLILLLTSCSSNKRFHTTKSELEKSNQEQGHLELREEEFASFEEIKMLEDSTGDYFVENPTALKTYIVEENETLMLIAFKIYGNYLRWKELAIINKEVLPDGYSLKKGMELQFVPPREKFTWSALGEPYLIRQGDTLGKISTKLYSTPKKWQILWHNNRPLIKDPNLIFAGFTLFYIPEQRPASNELALNHQ